MRELLHILTFCPPQNGLNWIIIVWSIAFHSQQSTQQPRLPSDDGIKQY